MRKSVILGVGFAIATACAVELGAQSTTPSSGANGTVTITGCLQRADQTRMPGATGTSGSSAATTTGGASTAAGTDEQFVLINAHMGSGMTSGSAGANGQSSGGITNGATSSGSSRGSNGGAAVDNSRRTMPYGTSGPWFMVDGDKDKLRSGVDHQVEIEGVIERTAAMPSGTAGTTPAQATGTSGSTTPTTSTASASAASPHMGEHLRATSIKVISPTCSE